MHLDEVCISQGRKGRLVIHRMNDIQKKTVKNIVRKFDVFNKEFWYSNFN